MLSDQTLIPQLTEEHEILRRAVRDFATNEIAPIAAEFDESGEFPMATIKKMGQMGLMGIEIPEEYGGAGMDTLAYALTMIEVARADASHSTIVSVNNSLFGHALYKFGTEAQKRSYLVPVASGEKIGAYSLTEPMSGSDAGTMQSRAVLNDAGTHYVINGRKSWVTSGPVADTVLLFTMTDPEKKHKGVSAFIIEADKPGFIRGKKEPKLGIRASATSEIVYENYECPVENMLGERGEGFKIAMTVLDAGRIGIASQALGIAEAAYEASLVYARERQAFGSAIGQFEMIQQKIADMKTRIEASRLLIYNACLAKERSKQTGERYTTEASMAKLFASETAMFVTDEAVQIHGGMGYSKEMPIERYYRDARITRIYEGTSEIQRLVIARNELGDSLMRAAVIYAHGGREVLQVVDNLPEIAPAAGMVRVQMKAAALNRLDLWVREGWKGLNLDMPHVCCADGAGIVESVGHGVTNVAVGDRVGINPTVVDPECLNMMGNELDCLDIAIMGEHAQGVAAEYVNVPARNLVKLPEPISFAQAAATGLVYVTSWYSMITRGGLKAGESVLVLGAGGGVSTASIQIAKLAGCKVYVVGSSAEKCQQAQALGADVTFDRSADANWSKAVFLATGKRGVDVVVDNVGQTTLPDSLRSVARGGRILIVGNTSGYQAAIDTRYIFSKQISLIGSSMGPTADFVTVMKMVFDGKLKPVIGATLPLAEISEGHRLLEEGNLFGKVVLEL